ncbi:MAG: hypothetical protein C5B60_01790 [Chloroflexi bacterium]|nr:MAG: hypothetical protein C5B60_01790 [Chloroflexota bacterium]
MWGEMFGLGPLMRLIQDPQLSQNANKVLQAIIDGQAATLRVEAKLDHLLRVLGHDPDRFGRSVAPTFFEGLSDRTGGPALANAIADHGSGGATPDVATPGPDAGPNGRSD